MSLDITTYFKSTSPWCDIADVTIDGQAMVRIPKFYIKVYTPSTGPLAGKICREVSINKAAGFHVHPAFMLNGAEIDQFYIGKYLAHDAGNSKAGSAAGSTPISGGLLPANMTTYCKNRNNEYVTGFHKMTVYEYAAIQLLIMIEIGTTDVLTAIGIGGASKNAIWHGIYDLWGSTFQNLEGVKGDSNLVYQIWDNQGNQTYQTTSIISTATYGYIVDMYTNIAGTLYDANDLFIPKNSTSDNSKGTYRDQTYQGRNGGFVVYAGTDGGSGIFRWWPQYNSDEAYGNCGFRLAKW